MTNRNGMLIYTVLKSYKEPVSAFQVTTDISRLTHVKPNKIRSIINETLNTGVASGFIQKKNKKYYTEKLPLRILPNGTVISVADSEPEYGDESEVEVRIRPMRSDRNKSSQSVHRKREISPEESSSEEVMPKKISKKNEFSPEETDHIFEKLVEALYCSDSE